MILRGDSDEKIKSRIENDRIAFKKEKIAKVDYIIDSSDKFSVEEVAEMVYKAYISHQNNQ